MKQIRILLCVWVALAAVACSTQKPSASNAPDYPYTLLMDSILQRGLDNEALYTLLSDMKPISSLSSVTICMDDLYSYAEKSTTQMPYASLARLEQVVRAANTLNLPDLKIVAIPYQMDINDKRSVQLSVVRISSLNRLLKEKSDFFGKLGLVPGTDPNVVVNTIEYSDKFDRWRGYGYLFGYPDYAVNFFVEAETERDKTGKFIERDAFRMATYSSKDGGNFVYTYPKGHIPTADVDSVLYYKASKVLEDYSKVRDQFLRSDSSLQAIKLIRQYGTQVK